MERIDACLVGSLLVAGWSMGADRLAVDERDRLERLVGDVQVLGRTDGVEDDVRRPLVGSGTTRETTGQGGRWCGEAGNGVSDGHGGVDGGGGTGRGTWVSAGLGANSGADMAGRGG